MNGPEISRFTGRREVRAAAGTLIVFAAAWAYLYRLQFLTPYLPGTDEFYHIKVAFLIRTQGLLGNFPWAAFSLWREQYFDKDFGYHLLLIPFTFGDLILGAKLAAVTFGAAFFASFFAVLRLNDVRWAWFWTVVLAASGGYFLWRVNVPRPHVFSMTLTLWSLFFIMRGSWKPVFFLSAVYALSYTAPHLVISYAAIHLLVARLRGQDWQVRPLLAAVVGVFVGIVVHPHFINALTAWRVQIVDVIWSGWSGRGPNLHLGGELLPADTRSFLVEHLPIYLAVLAAVLTYRFARKLWGAHVLTLFVLTNMFFVVTCLSKRFVEYFVPLTLWLCAEVVTGLPEVAAQAMPIAVRWFRHLRIAGVAVVGLILLALLVRSHGEISRDFAAVRPAGAATAARWLKENTLRDSVVFTCDWDDAPELFFFNHHNRYLVFLDPSFMYQWRSDLWETWQSIANGKQQDPVTAIREKFGANAGYCTSDFSALLGQLERDRRVRIVMRNNDAYVFTFPDSTPSISPVLHLQRSVVTPFFPGGDRVRQLFDRRDVIRWLDSYVDVCPSDFVDLARLTGVTKNACVNLRGTVTLAEAVTQFWIGTDDDAAVWVNDQLVYGHVGSRRARVREDGFWVGPSARSGLPLPTADLLIRVCQESGDWGLFLEAQAR